MSTDRPQRFGYRYIRRGVAIEELQALEVGTMVALEYRLPTLAKGRTQPSFPHIDENEFSLYLGQSEHGGRGSV